MFPLHEPLDEEVRSELSEHDDLTAALLARRGVLTKEEAARFLEPSYDEHLHDPLLMTDMEKAARRLATAIEEREHIAVWTDYDCDGIPAAVVLHDFLKKCGADFENYIPHRHDEGYGVNVRGIEKLVRENGAKLIVTADSGITDIDAVARAGALGADVIVTDHHLPLHQDSGQTGERLPDAYAVVDPNARKDETYPFRDLCGAGLAWKLVCATLAVAPALRERVPEGWEKWLLDMAGLATIADMVALTGENRVIARYGLLVMRKSPRLGLQRLCRLTRVNQRTMTEDDVGFMIAPRVNAASRMGDPYDAFRLFTATTEGEADEYAKRLEKANRQRKSAAAVITRSVHARLKERPVREVIALGDPSWRPSLLGLVANTIAEEYERPVFLWGREGNMSIKGSCRGVEGVHMVELMQTADDTFSQFGGHAAAGGFTVKDDAVFFLEDRLVEARGRLGDVLQEGEMLHADAELSPDEASDSLLAKLERLAPFGMGNDKPVFLLRDAVIAQISRFGKGSEHLKLKVVSGETGRGVEAVMFFAKGAAAKLADTLPLGSRANVLAHLERDTFTRGQPVRLRLLDIRLV